ncbi:MULTISPECIES: AraC family transcriptional regulator [Comamonas]|jgi:AraC-like DNA-binding protein|uniref:AraC family transcriptional regulator n=2 Tax=Comamonadaceae TaxID=80864 RepID=UPI001E40BCF9|nr:MULTISPECIES: AraC family transcriptional regulator [Comamonas]UNV92099.1 AraC family transcriptional regulator [Comamonas sp. 7D-2evo1]UNV94602.1 AraC family transcriptional regulator [Comamonas sp. 7D-2]UNW01735.1 AraC family transcriptional regulator [Comamonas sp. 7D-2evo2]BDB71311.1 transcriptional regulator [Comamonas thiooxydans]
MTNKANDWIEVRRDAETGIESIHAHFRGHAYDAHTHDELLVGVTQQGVQRFRCNRSVHTSVPGNAMLIEPGAVHDGHAPDKAGFTYAMLYLPTECIGTLLQKRGLKGLEGIEPAFKNTLEGDPQLQAAILQAFGAIHGSEGRLARDQALDQLLDVLSGHMHTVREANESKVRMARVTEHMHARLGENLGLEELADHAGVDRFRLARQFKLAYGQSPHSYLVNLRLRSARAMLAAGERPAQIATQLGFSDQSHLGRWFQRAYRMSPAAYQRQCTNVLS